MVVLVHGVVLGGRESWRAQRPMTERWTLLAPDRPGHGDSADAPQDFEPEAAALAEQLLREPVHVVGHSYGAVVAMLAAAARPDHVLSLTAIEPPATAVARGHPAVDAWDRELRALFAEAGALDERARLARFFAVAGVPHDAPDPLPAPLARGSRALIGARPPGEAELPLDCLRAAPFPKLVVSGGHMEPYETIADSLADATAGERAVIPGMAHLVQDTGAPFNERLERFLTASGR